MPPTPAPRRPRWAPLLLAAAPVALFLALFGALFAWNLHTTDADAAAAQAELRQQVAAGPEATAARADGPGENPSMDAAPAEGAEATAAPGTALGELWFERDGARWLGAPLIVVHGTDAASLALGPGHYPETPLPGGPGNAGIAGHRTTYGAPFGDLDQLARGDVVVVRTDAGTHRYEVRRTAVVDPDDVWVLQPDPLGRGRPTLTLTTCHPRHSDRHRLVVWSELAAADTA